MSTEKIPVNIRMHEFMKLVFDLYGAELRLMHGINTNADVMWQLLKVAAPDQIERVKQHRPDLWEQMVSEGYKEK